MAGKAGKSDQGHQPVAGETDTAATDQVLMDIALIPADTNELSDASAPSSGLMSKLERGIRVLSMVVVTAAACMAVWQYFEANRANRQAHSWDLMTEWKNSEVRQAYVRIGSALETYIVKNVSALPSGLSPDQLKIAQSGIGAGLVDQLRTDQIAYPQDWEADLRSIFDFYNEIAFCVESNFCDADLLQRYFEPDMRSVWDTFELYVQHQRLSLYPQFARAMEELLISFEE